MATLKDISKMACVSVSAISRVLNGDQSINVSEETRRKINAAARSLDYKPTPKKKIRQIKRISRIGIAQMFEAPQLLEDVYYLFLKSAIEELCFASGNETTLLFRNGLGRFAPLSAMHLDGIFALGSFSGEEVRSFEALSPNLVFLDSSPDDLKYCSVIPNYETGVRLALDTFIANGHKEIGFLGSKKRFGNDKMLEDDGRFIAFTGYLTRRKMPYEKYVYHCEMNSASSHAAMTKAIKNGKKLPSALFVSSDSMARGMMNAFVEYNIKVPQDISVISFNDTPASDNFTPSSVGVDIKANAKAAILMMEELLTGNLRIPYKIIVSCYYKERDSVLAL